MSKNLLAAAGLKRQSMFLAAADFSPAHTHAVPILHDADPANNLSAVALFYDPDGTVGSRLACNAGADGYENTSALTVDLLAGTPGVAEVGTTGLAGVLMNTDADAVSWMGRVPRDWDLKHKVGFRVLWATASTEAADTVAWKVTYGAIAAGEALAAPATALSTAIAEDTVDTTTAYVLQRSERGILDGGSIAAADLLVALGVEMDAKAVGLSEDLFFIGLECDYVPLLTTGRPVQNDPGE